MNASSFALPSHPNGKGVEENSPGLPWVGSPTRTKTEGRTPTGFLPRWRPLMHLCVGLTFIALLMQGNIAQAQTSSKSKAATSSKAKAKSKPKATTETDDEPKATTKPKPSTETNDEPKAKPTPKPKPEPTEGPKAEPRVASVATMATSELFGFYDYPPEVQRLIEDALALTRRNLTYTFGSSNPSAGGMDCSGTIYYLLQTQGLKTVPRQSDEMAEWARDHSKLHTTPEATTFDDAVFADLEPGDMLFWSGTYETGARDLPISHVMIYLGKRKSDKKRVAFGASDGRYYKGERRCGVSVFDLTFPKAEGKATFYGYGSIPGLAKVKPRETVRRADPEPVKVENKVPVMESEKAKTAESSAVKKPLVTTTESREEQAKSEAAALKLAASRTPKAPTKATAKPEPEVTTTTKKTTTKPKAKPSETTTTAAAASKPKAKPPIVKAAPKPEPSPTKQTASSTKPKPQSPPTAKLPPGITRNAKRLVNGIRSLFD